MIWTEFCLYKTTTDEKKKEMVFFLLFTCLSLWLSFFVQQRKSWSIEHLVWYSPNNHWLWMCVHQSEWSISDHLYVYTQIQRMWMRGESPICIYIHAHVVICQVLTSANVIKVISSWNRQNILPNQT